MNRRSFVTSLGAVGLISLSGCTGNDTTIPDEFNSIELQRKRIRSDLTRWVISVDVDKSSNAYYIDHKRYKWETQRKELPQNNYTVEFTVASLSDDAYYSYPPTNHKFVLIDGSKRIAEAEVDFAERISVSNPGFMSQAHGEQDTAGNWVSKAGGGHTGFTFEVTNTGEFPVQLASAVVKGDIPLGSGPVHKYWPTAVWFKGDDGKYHFKGNIFGDAYVDPSLVIGPSESTRVGAMGYNVSEYDSLCNGSTRNARVVIKTLNEYGVRGRFKYHLSGQKDAGGCTKGEIEDFEEMSHFG